MKLRKQNPIHKKNKIFRLTFYIFALLILFSFIIIIVKWILPKEKITSPFSDINLDKNKLLKLLKNQADQDFKNYSILIADFNGKFYVGIDENTIFTAASLNKVPIFAVLYNLHQKKEIDLDKKISIQKNDIQDYGTGSIRYDQPGTEYSLKTLARLMIEKSDNTASYILTNQIIGIDRIQNIINEWGLTQTNIKNNKTSNSNMYEIFKKIYLGKITDASYVKEMLDFLKNTDFENRLPAELPEGVKVYHKIGTEVGFVHDVGIVETEKLTYYIGILTADEPDETLTSQKIARLSKIVYDFISD